MGRNSQANGYASTVVGLYNDTILASQTSITNTTPLFIVGNGDNSSTLSNAMVVRKDDKVGIGNTATADRLLVNAATGENPFRVQVNGSTKMRIFSNGSISLGTNNSGISAGDVYVHNNLGVGVSAPSYKLEVNGNIHASGTITSSDIRYKKDINTLNNSSKILAKINPVSYTFRTKEFSQFDTKLHMGVIAQELEKILPNMVYTDNKGFKAVNYTEFIPLLINSNNEQQDIINKLQEKLSTTDEKLKANEELVKQQQQQQIQELYKLLQDLKLNNATVQTSGF